MDLVTDNLKLFHDKGWFDFSRNAITRKLAKLGVTYQDPKDQTICAFIDCNCLETPRVMHGPAQPGKKLYNFHSI
jgi:hypothetical protein